MDGYLTHSGATGPQFCDGCGPGVPITTPGPAQPAPVFEIGRGFATDDPMLRDAIGADAAQRIAIDLQAISQGVLSTRADLDVLREGVADLAEGFENKIDGLRERFITEIDRIFDENRKNYELAQERRIDDHGTLHDRFEVLKSNINDRLVDS